MNRELSFPLAMSAVLALAGAPVAQQPFVPARHLPGPGHVVLEVSSAEALLSGFKSTLPGALTLHPDLAAGTKVLVDALRERIDEVVGPLEMLTSVGLDDVGSLLSGGFTLALGELRNDGPPQLVLALPAPGGAGDLAMVGRLLALAFPGDVGEPQVLGELTVTPVPGPAGPLFAGLIGDQLVLATESESVQVAHALWKTNAESESLAATPGHASLAAALGGRYDGLRLAVDLAGLREAALELQNPEGVSEERRGKLAAVGLDRLEAFGVQAGFRDGGWAKTVHLGLRGGGDGMLDAFRASLLPVRRVDEALAIIPAAAHEMSAFRVSPAATYEKLAALYPDELADARAALADLAVEQELDWSPEALFDRLPTLGDIEVFVFAIEPPAGGLFSDRVALVRTDEVEPYWQLVLDLVEGWGPELTERDVAGAKVRSFDLVTAAQATDVLRLLLSGVSFDELPEAAKLGFALPFLLPVGNLVRADIPGGWSVLSGSSHAVTRFLVLGPSSEPMSANETAAERVRQVLGGAVMGSLFDTGDGLLATYNTLLGLGDQLAPLLALFGVDVGALPPAESFLRLTGMGYVRVVSNEQGITVWSHRAGIPSLMVGAAAGLWTGLLGTGVAGTLVLPQTLQRPKQAQVLTTEAKQLNLQQTLILYRMKHDRVPDTLDVLLEPDALRLDAPWVDDPTLLFDAWERAFLYRRIDDSDYEIVSLGADGQQGGEGANADLRITAN